ncbi:MAG: YqaJ viral recombinase family protein [Pseudomonadota bacterium]
MQRENSLTRQIHNLLQGSDEWHLFRQEHDGASEAAAALGLSKKAKRSELIRMKATGIGKEFTAWVQENILDHGHVVEAMARPLVEKIIGDDLYPVTCSLGRLSASCDGLTMSETTAFEHKQWNAALAAAVAAGELPEEYMPQCQQVLMVTGAERLIFVVSDGTEENMVHMWVQPDAAWFDRIRAGWDQFDLDVAAYVPAEPETIHVAAPAIALPALVIQTRGEVTQSNLPAFRTAAEQFLAGIKTQLETDEDFLDAAQAVKDCEKAEREIDQAKIAATAQMSTVDEVLRIADQVAELIRARRLMLVKLIDTEKSRRKETILSEGKRQYAEHITALEKEIAPLRLQLPQPDFAAAMKNKRTLTGLQDAVNTTLANGKIAASTQAADYRAKQAWCKESAAGHGALFMDMATIITKPMDDFQLVITTRVAAHKAAEEKKEADLRARIAAEEKAKAEAAAAETARLAAIEASKVADAAAQVERDRVAADTKRQLEEQAKSIAAARAAEKPVAQASISAGAAPAAARQRQFYTEAPVAAEVARLQGLADQNLADKRGMAQAARMTGVPMRTRSYPTAPASLLDAADSGPSDQDILDFGAQFDMEPDELVPHLERFIANARAGLLTVAA